MSSLKWHFRLLLLPIFIFAESQVQAQDMYLGFSFDPNKAFGIVDNKRTVVDHRGLDYDIELGYLTGKVGLFTYYGAFKDANYQIFGLGGDYYILRAQRWHWSAGASLGALLKGENTVSDSRINYFAANMRSILSWWAFDQCGFTGRLQYQMRPDIAEIGIIEISLGMRYRFSLPF